MRTDAARRQALVAEVLLGADGAVARVGPRRRDHAATGRLLVAEADAASGTRMSEAWKRVPSSRRPAVHTQPNCHQSRTPHEWSRWPWPSNSMRSAPSRISPCTRHGIS